MGTLNASHLESNPAAAGTERPDDFDLELSRAFEQIKRTDDEALDDYAGFEIVIWPDEFQ